MAMQVETLRPVPPFPSLAGEDGSGGHLECEVRAVVGVDTEKAMKAVVQTGEGGSDGQVLDGVRAVVDVDTEKV